MTPPLVSLKLHRLIQYLKRTQLKFTADDLTDLGVELTLRAYQGIELDLAPHEIEILEKEVLKLAEKEDIREAVRMYHRSHPEDRGVTGFRQASTEMYGQASVWPVPYSYPVDDSLKSVRKKRTPGTMIRRYPLQGGYRRWRK